MTVSDAIYMVAGFLLSLGMMLLIMPALIDYLRKIKFGQSEREEGLESHKAKNGTPTMGGIAFILVPIFVFLLFSLFTPYKLDSNVGIILLAYVGYGLIGFLDDFIIVVRKNNEGLKPWIKLALQSVLAVVFFALYTRSHETTILIPVANIYINIGWLYFVLVFFMFTAETNAVNFSDGVDGLCAGLMIIALFPFVVFALIQSAYAVAFFILLVIAALAGYLKFNMHPAKVFMGDTGSLALGGLISAVAMVLKEELLLILIGGVFVAELLSVVIQVSHYKRTKKRIFRMAPLHHHFEKGGMPETQVVTGFWVAGAICSLLGLILGVL
jgi:phospho-N-acetylmuramoyl-pentapeptide-transferase